MMGKPIPMWKDNSNYMEHLIPKGSIYSFTRSFSLLYTFAEYPHYARYYGYRDKHCPTPSGVCSLICRHQYYYGHRYNVPK